MRNKYSLALILLLSVAALSACTPSRVELIPELTNDSAALSGGKGVVMLRVADASDLIGFRINQVTLAPKNVNASDTEKFPRLTAIEDGGRTSSTYVAALAAGNYTITSLRSFHDFGTAYYSRSLPVDIRLGTFTIKPGELTNLGTVIFYPNFTGKDLLVKMTRNPSFADAPELLTSRFPGIAALLKPGSAALGWDEDGLDEERQVAYASITQSPVAWNQAVDIGNGALAFPGRLGTTMVRSADGSWHVDALENDYDVIGLVHSADGDYIATEFGHLCLRKAAGERCATLPLPSLQGSLAGLALGSNGHLYAIERQERALVVHDAADPRHPVWIEAGRFEARDASVLGPIGAQPVTDAQFAALPDDLFVTVSALNGVGNIYRLHFADNSKTEIRQSGALATVLGFGGDYGMRPFAQNKRVYAVASHGGDKLLRLDPQAGWVALDRRIHEAGEKPATTQVKRIRTAMPPHFWDTNNAWALYFEGRTEAAAWDVRYNVWHSTDGGESWEMQADALTPPGCGQLVPEIGPGKLMVYCTFSGEFHLSTDGGKTWKADRRAQLQ